MTCKIICVTDLYFVERSKRCAFELFLLFTFNMSKFRRIWSSISVIRLAFSRFFTLFDMIWCDRSGTLSLSLPKKGLLIMEFENKSEKIFHQKQRKNFNVNYLEWTLAVKSRHFCRKQKKLKTSFYFTLNTGNLFFFLMLLSLLLHFTCEFLFSLSYNSFFLSTLMIVLLVWQSFGVVFSARCIFFRLRASMTFLPCYFVYRLDSAKLFFVRFSDLLWQPSSWFLLCFLFLEKWENYTLFRLCTGTKIFIWT